MDTIGTPVVRLWFHGRHRVAAAISGTPPTHAASWIDEGWLLYLASRARPKGSRGASEYVLCLTELDETQQQSLLAMTDEAGACWVGDLKARLTDPQVAFPAWKKYRRVSLAGNQACAITVTGAVVCCGERGHLVDEAPAATVRALSISNHYGCALAMDGSIACWGYASVRRPVPSGTFSDVKVWHDEACALAATGTVTCWGVRGENKPPPTVPLTSFGAGRHGACGLGSDGLPRCWRKAARTPPGHPYLPHVAVVSHGPYPEPPFVCGLFHGGWTDCGHEPPRAGLVEVAVGALFTCGRLRDGAVVCWPTRAQPVAQRRLEVPSVPGTFRQIDGHGTAFCGVRTDRSIACWGDPWPTSAQRRSSASPRHRDWQ